MTVADLNGDARHDIAVANRTEDTGEFSCACLNRGDGRFDDDCVAFARESATTITLAGFDGDGSLDLAVPHQEGGQSYIYLNDGRGGFRERRPFGPPDDAAIRKADAADLNGDGLLDLVVIDERKGAAVHPGSRDGAFEAAIPLGDASRTPYALAVGDLNQDGFVDLIVG